MQNSPQIGSLTGCTWLPGRSAMQYSPQIGSLMGGTRPPGRSTCSITPQNRFPYALYAAAGRSTVQNSPPDGVFYRLCVAAGRSAVKCSPPNLPYGWYTAAGALRFRLWGPGCKTLLKRTKLFTKVFSGAPKNFTKICPRTQKSQNDDFYYWFAQFQILLKPKKTLLKFCAGVFLHFSAGCRGRVLLRFSARPRQPRATDKGTHLGDYTALERPGTHVHNP